MISPDQFTQAVLAIWEASFFAIVFSMVVGHVIGSESVRWLLVAMCRRRRMARRARLSVDRSAGGNSSTVPTSPKGGAMDGPTDRSHHRT